MATTSHTPAEANGPHRRLPRADRERQMVDVGRRLFAERGYGAVTMDELAAAVGITKPLLYTYFGNKEQLYLACMAPAGEALIAEVVGAVREADRPGRALERGLEAFFAALDRDRAAWRVLFDESLPASSSIAAQVAVYRRRLAELVEGELLAQLGPDLSAGAREEVRALSEAVFGAAEGLSRWWLREGRITAGEAAQLLGGVLSAGLRERERRRREEADDG